MIQSSPTIFAIEEKQNCYILRGIKRPSRVYSVDISKKLLGMMGKRKAEYTLEEFIELSNEALTDGGFALPSIQEIYDILLTLYRNREHPEYVNLIEQARKFIEGFLQQGPLLTSSVAYHGHDGKIVHNEGLPNQFISVASSTSQGVPFLGIGRYDSEAVALKKPKEESFKECWNDLTWHLLCTPTLFDTAEKVFQWTFQHQPRVRSIYLNCNDKNSRDRRLIGIVRDAQDQYYHKDEFFTTIDTTLDPNKKYSAPGIRIREKVEFS